MSSAENATFLFSMLKRYVNKYSRKPSIKEMYSIKKSLVPMAIDLYKREECSYDDALMTALDELDKE